MHDKLYKIVQVNVDASEMFLLQFFGEWTIIRHILQFVSSLNCKIITT